MRRFHDAAFEARTLFLDFDVDLDGSWTRVSIYSRGRQCKGQQCGSRFIVGRTASAVEFQPRCCFAANISVPDKAALALARFGSSSIAIADGIPVARKGLARAFRSVAGDSKAAVALVGTEPLAEVAA